MEEDCLGLIVRRMAHGNAIGPQLSRRCPQERIAHSPRGILGGEPMVLLVDGNVACLTDALEAKVVCCCLDEASVFTRVGTHLMVQMGDVELQGQGVPELPERVQ
jgi:hypothetical protein